MSFSTLPLATGPFVVALVISFLCLSKVSNRASSTGIGFRQSNHRKLVRLNELVEMPEIGELMAIAFPYWDVDESGEPVNEPHDEDRLWNPYYLTKRYDGMEMKYGGHPTDIDVKYPFYFGSPFLGQPGAGTPHHCPEDSATDIAVQTCPKVETLDDNGAYGPGHVPPHIALAALTWWIRDHEGEPFQRWFDYNTHECRIKPHELLKIVRAYFPRVDGDTIDYKPSYDPEGGGFQYEFPSGRGVDNQEPPYESGSPHWCTDEFVELGQWADYCPYVHEGPDAGAYRHPHVAFAALETWLANMNTPDLCGPEWLDNNEYPMKPNSNMAFPKMLSDDNTVDGWKAQPNISSGFVWPGMEGRKKKPFAGGQFALGLVVVEDSFCAE